MQVIKLESSQMEVNTYIVYKLGHNDAIVIDPAFEHDRLILALNSENLTVKAILLTHGHFDHIAGLQALREKTGAPVYMHEKDASMLARPGRNLSLYRSKQVIAEDADNLLTGTEKLPIADMSVQVISTPGHTPGSVCYRIEDMLFSGDTLFASSVGNTEFPGGSYTELMRSLKRLENIGEDLIVHPGHGNSTSLFFEMDNNPYWGD